jgi:hypothetical protein
LVPILEFGALLLLLTGGRGADPICFAAGTWIKNVVVVLFLLKLSLKQICWLDVVKEVSGFYK